jgi:hypothetical protein
MYEPHSDLVVPRNDARIWRYMDLGKFLSILHNSILFFSRVDLLRDPYECMPNPSTVEDYLRRTGRDWQEMNRLMQGSRQWTYANSWHMNQFRICRNVGALFEN